MTFVNMPTEGNKLPMNAFFLLFHKNQFNFTLNTNKDVDGYVAQFGDFLLRINAALVFIPNNS